LNCKNDNDFLATRTQVGQNRSEDFYKRLWQGQNYVKIMPTFKLNDKTKIVQYGHMSTPVIKQSSLQEYVRVTMHQLEDTTTQSDIPTQMKTAKIRKTLTVVSATISASSAT